VASFQKRIQPGKKSRILKSPRICGTFLSRSCLVIKVSTLESHANFEAQFQTIYCILRFHCKQSSAIDKSTGLFDNVIANLSHQHNEPCRCIVEFGVPPDQQNSVQHRLKERDQLWESFISQTVDESLKRFEISHIIIRLHSSLCNLFA